MAFPASRDSGQNEARGAEEVLLALALAVEQRDNVTAGHCERLALTSVALGMKMSLDHASLQTLYRGGFLHDIGKVGIPDSILFKPAKLSEEEWVVMRGHPAIGAQICCHLRSLSQVLPLVRHHHERWDGSGYPDGLRGEQIPLTARVLQIADIYDALTNSRCYKEAFTPEQAIGILEEETARGWRDPEIMGKFLAIHQQVLPLLLEYTHRLQRLSALNNALVNFTRILRPVAALMDCCSIYFPVGSAA
jgi:putative two-component system response regulator